MPLSTILLDEESVSALHAELIAIGNRRYLLRDLRSTNGTTVNGRSVSEVEIVAPCQVAFGRLRCELEVCNSPDCLQHGPVAPSHVRANEDDSSRSLREILTGPPVDGEGSTTTSLTSAPESKNRVPTAQAVSAPLPEPPTTSSVLRSHTPLLPLATPAEISSRTESLLTELGTPPPGVLGDALERDLAELRLWAVRNVTAPGGSQHPEIPAPSQDQPVHQVEPAVPLEIIGRSVGPVPPAPVSGAGAVLLGLTTKASLPANSVRPVGMPPIPTRRVPRRPGKKGHHRYDTGFKNRSAPEPTPTKGPLAPLQITLPAAPARAGGVRPAGPPPPAGPALEERAPQGKPQFISARKSRTQPIRKSSKAKETPRAAAQLDLSVPPVPASRWRTSFQRLKGSLVSPSPRDIAVGTGGIVLCALALLAAGIGLAPTRPNPFRGAATVGLVPLASVRASAVATAPATLPASGTPIAQPPAIAEEEPVKSAIAVKASAPEPPAAPVPSLTEVAPSAPEPSSTATAAPPMPAGSETPEVLASSPTPPAPDLPGAATARMALPLDAQEGFLAVAKSSPDAFPAGLDLPVDDSPDALMLATPGLTDSPPLEARLAPPASRADVPAAVDSESPATTGEATGWQSAAERLLGGHRVDVSTVALLASNDWNWNGHRNFPPNLLPSDFALGISPLDFRSHSGAARRGGDSAPPSRPAAPVPPQAMSVMILGDSLALCGFGSRLDHRFRQADDVRVTNTYMACGTVPLSWLKDAPFTNIKTYCGFWSIEGEHADKKPSSFQDTYGMGNGLKPKPHPVPKLEDLFARNRPDVLVIQTGTNLFSLFRDGKTVQPEHHAVVLRNQIQPFLAKLLKIAPSLRKIYWVAPPTSGRVAAEIQDFAVEQVRQQVGPMATVIDSRTIITYPYKHMEPDKEHFIGSEMEQWADGVYDIVQKDLASHGLPLVLATPAGLVPAKGQVAALATDIPKSALVKIHAAPPLKVLAKLVAKSKPMRPEELKPYQESLVSFVYEVQKVEEGDYADQKLMVMHPAHIGLKSQPLEKMKVGKTYELNLHELEGTPWNTIKSKDDSGLNDLLPYIQVEDEARFPAHEP